MQERLNKFIAASGAASRRKADLLIAEGKVFVNGKKIESAVAFVDTEKDIVVVDGKPVSKPQEFTYYAAYKPRGYTSTSEDPHAEKKVTDLVPASPRVFPVGRLDRDSEGLMILTNDGETALRLTHPRYEHEKEYRIKIMSRIYFSPDLFRKKIQNLETGVETSFGATKVSSLKILEIKGREAILTLVLKEGKKRQIRIMCGVLGFDVLELVRIRIGKLNLGRLLPGKYKKIHKDEII